MDAYFFLGEKREGRREKESVSVSVGGFIYRYMEVGVRERKNEPKSYILKPKLKL